MTDDELTEMACAAKLHHCMCVDIELPRLREFARMIAEAEQEACAKACDAIAEKYAGQYWPDMTQTGSECAAAIRAMKE